VDDDGVRVERLAEGAERLREEAEKVAEGLREGVFWFPFIACCMLGRVSWGTAMEALAIAMPDAAIAPASPVGLRLGVDPRLQLRFFFGTLTLRVEAVVGERTEARSESTV